jgi:hypothetical protein
MRPSFVTEVLTEAQILRSGIDLQVPGNFVKNVGDTN